MTLRTIVVAGVSTTAAVAAASTAVWLAVAPQSAATGGAGAAPPPPAASPPPGGSRTVVVVCVGADQIVRSPRPQGGCPSGQRKVDLRPEEEMCQLCPPFDERREPDSSDNEALNDLERRIRALENGPYFEVVNDNEQPIFRVGPGGVRIFNQSGVAVAAFGSSESGGYFTASSGTALMESSIAASGTTAGVRMVEDGLVRLELSAREGGGAALRVPSGDGLIAGLGASVSGPGTLLLGTLDGQVKSSLTVPDGRGMVSVNQDLNGGGASLLEARIGGGMFEIADAKGQSAIKMGHVDHRYGIVLAGPVLGLPLVPRSGLPGSYFMGCGSQAPPACMPVAP